MSHPRMIPMARWLKEQNAQLQGLDLERVFLFPDNVFTDTREIPDAGVYLPLRGERFDGHTFLEQALAQGARWAFCERAYYQAHQASLAQLPLVLVDDTRTALQSLARAWRRELKVPVIAITGSSGKTSTKEILKQVFARDFEVHATPANWNNEIGVPKTLLGLTPQHTLCIVEMGMRGPGQIRELCEIAEPDWGVITNVGPVHIGELGSQEAVTRAKWEMADYLFERWGADVPRLVINGDNVFLAEKYAALPETHQRAVARVGTHEDHDIQLCETHVEQSAIPLQTLHYALQGAPSRRLQLDLLGTHQALNLLCGLMLLHLLGAPPLEDQCLRVPRLSGRQESHDLPQGGVLINDAYNANPDSMRAALQAFMQLPGPHLAVLGMMGELGEKAADYHRELGAFCAQLPLQKVIVVGEGAQPIMSGLRADQGRFCASAAEAVTVLQRDYAEWPGSHILVKASRSAQLEDVVKGFLHGD